ncbi:MAG TPA: metallophosphoesterase [Tepidisphaeraceae bacterium]|nr:metallophosphoesterase [Tepidisphaeraceae bacterium]
MRWIIGDIHGMRVPLVALLEAVRATDAAARFYFVGDYVNRGSESRQVVDVLLSLEGAKFVRGNHDDVFDQVLHGQAYTGETSAAQRLAAFQWFMQHGLDATLMSYGVDALDLEQALRRPSVGALERLTESVPEGHRRFFHHLPGAIEEPDLFVVHAKWDPDSPSDAIAARAGSSQRTRYTVLWGRFAAAEIERKKRWRRRGFFGHTPVFNYAGSERDGNTPIIREDIVLLDTAAAISPAGRLTAVCAETSEYLQVDRRGSVVMGERRRK